MCQLSVPGNICDDVAPLSFREFEVPTEIPLIKFVHGEAREAEFTFIAVAGLYFEELCFFILDENGCGVGAGNELVGCENRSF